jgi:hypothetical protein
LILLFGKNKANVHVFNIQADRFLRNMVRAIVGTLLEVGRGKLSVEDFCEVIEAKNRGCAGTSAPAHGLYLVDVIYPENIFTPKAKEGEVVQRFIRSKSSRLFPPEDAAFLSHFLRLHHFRQLFSSKASCPDYKLNRKSGAALKWHHKAKADIPQQGDTYQPAKYL